MFSLHKTIESRKKKSHVLHTPIICQFKIAFISEFQSVLSCLLGMDNGFTTKQWKHGRRRSSITCSNIVLWKKLWFGMISNQITKF